MPALRPTTEQKESYRGSPEELNGLPPSSTQELSGAEINQRTEVLNDHARLIDLFETKQSEALGVFSSLIGNGVDFSFTLAHGLGKEPTRSAVILIGNNSEPVGVSVKWNSLTITVGPFASAPSSNQYRVIAQ